MNMDFKISRSTLPAPEVIYDNISEQGIELDYILPDYYPPIFRVIKCEALPEIISWAVSGNRISYELSVIISIWYCSENSTDLNILRQKQTFSKIAETGQDISDADILLSPRTDYINCRVVNEKRTDIKGAVTTCIRVTGEKQQEIVSSAEGLNVQIKKRPVEYTFCRLRAVKKCEISEKLELNQDKPQVKAVIRTEIDPGIPETRIIAGKLVAKGNADLKVLYSCEKQGQCSVEIMKYTVPYSQIIDMDGIDETYKCFIRAEAVNADVSSAGDSILKCEFTVNMRCYAEKTSQTEIITDIYSTRYSTDFESGQIRICGPSFPLNERISCGYNIESAEETIEKVYDAWCSCSGLSASTDESCRNIIISGMMKYSVLIQNSEGKTVLIEKENACEHFIPVSEIRSECIIDAGISAVNCSYNLISGSRISVSSDILVYGQIISITETDAVTDISVDTQEQCCKDKNYAVRLYFGKAGESVWDIARKYRTSLTAVMEENELTDDELKNDCMVLIPIVN